MAGLDPIGLYDKINELKVGRGTVAGLLRELIDVNGIGIGDKMMVFGFLVLKKLDAAALVLVQVLDANFIVIEPAKPALTPAFGGGNDKSDAKNPEEAELATPEAFGMRDALLQFHLINSDMAASGEELKYQHGTIGNAGAVSSANAQALLASADFGKNQLF